MKAEILLATGQLDLGALVIALVGYLIVFLALVLLYWFFRHLPKLLFIKFKKERRKKGIPVPDEQESISGEEIAAISIALHLLFSDMHDEESGVLTIKKVSKTYSPWSSKIYAVRNQFNRI